MFTNNYIKRYEFTIINLFFKVVIYKVFLIRYYLMKDLKYYLNIKCVLYIMFLIFLLVPNLFLILCNI
jgi:hypothetical protein